MSCDVVRAQRQRKARNDNEHKAFVSETTAKIQDANRINEGSCEVMGLMLVMCSGLICLSWRGV